MTTAPTAAAPSPPSAPHRTPHTMPCPTTRLRRGWGSLLSGRWITPEDPVLENHSVWLEIPPGFEVAMFIGRGGRNVKALRNYTGVSIYVRDQESMLVKGDEPSVMLALAMITDFFHGIEMGDSLDILRGIQSGAIQEPYVYVEGTGFVPAFAEGHFSELKPKEHCGVPRTTDGSSPPKDAKACAWLTSQEDFEEHYINAPRQAWSEMEELALTLEHQLCSLLISSGDERDEVESVRPLDAQSRASSFGSM